jgi:hypothetical protein
MNGVVPFTTLTMDPRLLAIADIIRNILNWLPPQTTNPDPLVVSNYHGIEKLC